MGKKIIRFQETSEILILRYILIEGIVSFCVCVTMNIFHELFIYIYFIYLNFVMSLDAYENL